MLNELHGHDVERLLAALQSRDVDLIAQSIVTIQPLVSKIVQLHQLRAGRQSQNFSNSASGFETLVPTDATHISPHPHHYHQVHRENGERTDLALSQDIMPVDLSASRQSGRSFSRQMIQQYSKKKSESSKAKQSRFPSKQPTKCNICSKVVRADNFQIHLRSHTGEKPFKCNLCPFKTANPSSMPKHMKLHERGKKVYYCDQCSYSTIYKSNLTAHQRSHPFMSVCNSDSLSPDSTSNNHSATLMSFPTSRSDSILLAPASEYLPESTSTALDLTIKYSPLQPL